MKGVRKNVTSHASSTTAKWQARDGPIHRSTFVSSFVERLHASTSASHQRTMVTSTREAGEFCILKNGLNLGPQSGDWIRLRLASAFATRLKSQDCVEFELIE